VAVGRVAVALLALVPTLGLHQLGPLRGLVQQRRLVQVQQGRARAVGRRVVQGREARGRGRGPLYLHAHLLRYGTPACT
jgi:hypothetical protein